MSIYNAGTVADVVGSVAAQGSATEAGARWLNAYIDPAHGNCDTIPDEDNIYSTPLKSHFTYTLDNSFFVAPGVSPSAIPSTRSFTVYCTNFPDYPIAVLGEFILSDSDRQLRLCFIEDPNLFSTINSNSNIDALRMMYKGCTLRYTGNNFDNQGVLTSCQFAAGTNYAKSDVTYNTSFHRLFGKSNTTTPVTATDIASTNKEFYVNRQDMGLYCSNQIMGARSNYFYEDGYKYYWDASTLQNSSFTYIGTPFTDTLVDNGTRFRNATVDYSNPLFFGSRMPLNCTVVVARFDNVDSNQSILIEHFGGYQCHVAPKSTLVNFQSFKSYLDPNALATASQLTASIPCIWPASYNDFKAVWRRIGGFIGSATGQSLVSSIARVSGRYGGLINAIGGLFV